jgi:hypothetical protein
MSIVSFRGRTEEHGRRTARLFREPFHHAGDPVSECYGDDVLRRGDFAGVPPHLTLWSAPLGH